MPRRPSAPEPAAAARPAAAAEGIDVPVQRPKVLPANSAFEHALSAEAPISAPHHEAMDTLSEDRQVDVDITSVEAGAACQTMAAKLASQGFCTVEANVSLETLKQAHESIRLLGDTAFERPPLAIRNGLLGRGSAAMLPLQSAREKPDHDRPEHRGLAEIDALMDSTGENLGPSSGHPAFSFSHRTHFMVCRSSLKIDSEQSAPITPEAVRAWEPIFAAQRLLIIVFLGPGDASLQLGPHTSTAANLFEVSLRPGSMVLVRPEILACRLVAQERALTMATIYMSLSGSSKQKVVAPVATELSEWVLDYLEEVKECQTEDNFISWSSSLPQQWRLLMNHNFYRGNYIPVMGHSIKVPSSWDLDSWTGSMIEGCDSITDVPINRWDHDQYFDADMDSWKWGKSYSSHAGFAEGMNLFDANFFKMSAAEVSHASPHQRQVLDCGYEALRNAGYNRKALMNSRIAHITAFGSLQWNFIDKSDLGTGGAYGACGEAASIVAARLSYILGMKGNCFVVDTEGASGLTALHSCCDAIQERGHGLRDAAALATASYINLSPMMWPGMCAAALLSREGRCLTFSSTADGYVQTDGIAAAVVKPLNPVDEEADQDDSQWDGLITAMVMNHNGMGASLTSAKGSSEQEIVLEATHNAMLSPLDVDAVECHGGGAYLADAIEISSMMRAHRSFEENDPLGIMAVKSGSGNMLYAAGLTAFLKVLFGAQRNVMSPLCHLHIINPHIEMDEDTPALVPTETTRFRTTMGSFTGTMSRGFGGTNVYALSQGKVKVFEDEAVDASSKLLHENMLSYWPGGGGSLALASVPSEGYQIAGSFNDWTPQRMELVDPGAFVHIVTLPEEGVAEFQIWLDGDLERVLYPQWPQAASSTPVLGPADSAQQTTWLICNENMQPGVSGDQYRVMLQIFGKWQTVTWTKA